MIHTLAFSQKPKKQAKGDKRCLADGLHWGKSGTCDASYIHHIGSKLRNVCQLLIWLFFTEIKNVMIELGQ